MIPTVSFMIMPTMIVVIMMIGMVLICLVIGQLNGKIIIQKVLVGIGMTVGIRIAALILNP